jgi:hypothetical protein
LARLALLWGLAAVVAAIVRNTRAAVGYGVLAAATYVVAAMLPWGRP